MPVCLYLYIKTGLFKVYHRLSFDNYGSRYRVICKLVPAETFNNIQEEKPCTCNSFIYVSVIQRLSTTLWCFLSIRNYLTNISVQNCVYVCVCVCVCVYECVCVSVCLCVCVCVC